MSIPLRLLIIEDCEDDALLAVRELRRAGYDVRFERVETAVAMAAVGSLIILKVVDALIGLRVPEEHEVKGLDVTQHGEEGYNFEF